MRKRNILMCAMALGVAFGGPALANKMTEDGSMHRFHCRSEGSIARHCRHHHAWGYMAENRALFVQSGQDLNTNRWTDGSPRHTLPPHNSRGTERPSTDSGMDYSGTWVRPE